MIDEFRPNTYITLLYLPQVDSYKRVRYIISQENIIDFSGICRLSRLLDKKHYRYSTPKEIKIFKKGMRKYHPFLYNIHLRSINYND